MRRDQHSNRRRVRQYVSAVLETAEEGDDWEDWEDELIALYRVATDAAVRAVVTRPGASADEQQSDFDVISEGIVGDRGRSVGHVLIQDGTFDLVPAVRVQFIRRSETEGPIDRVTVRSAVPMSGADLDGLREQMQTQGRRMIFHEELDPTIKGGFVLRHGDWRRDFSVEARLDALKQALR
jgi:F-type H+-transporting ATPase subunit delta